MLREVGQFYITGEEGVNRRNVDLEALAAGWMSCGHGKQCATTAEHSPHEHGQPGDTTKSMGCGQGTEARMTDAA
jgi:hypothetical protein